VVSQEVFFPFIGGTCRDNAGLFTEKLAYVHCFFCHFAYPGFFHTKLRPTDIMTSRSQMVIA